MSPTSSRNSVPPLRELEAADLLRDGAGKRALLVPEELALEQAGRNRGAVQLDERARDRRLLRLWIARAISSLPVPVSP